MPALESSQTLSSIVSTLVPHMEEQDRKNFIDDLNDSTELLNPVYMNEPEEFEFEEINPEKAAEFFRTLGIKTR